MNRHERINRNIRKQIYGVQREIVRVKNEIKEYENSDFTRTEVKRIESEINRVESEIRKRKQSFNEIATKSKIEWFRNSWIKNKPQNLIQEIKYWLQ
jgi:predicted transcriptional regulator